MKKTLLTILILCSYLLAFGQTWVTAPTSGSASAQCADATSGETATCETVGGEVVYISMIDLADPAYYNPATLDLTHNRNVKLYLETTLILKTASFGTSYAPARNVWSNSVVPTAYGIGGLGNMFAPTSTYSNYYLLLKYTKN